MVAAALEAAMIIQPTITTADPEGQIYLLQPMALQAKVMPAARKMPHGAARVDIAPEALQAMDVCLPVLLAR